MNFIVLDGLCMKFATTHTLYIHTLFSIVPAGACKLLKGGLADRDSTTTRTVTALTSETKVVLILMFSLPDNNYYIVIN